MLNEITVLAGVALVYTVFAVWAAAPVRACVMGDEPARHLNLEREVDREHLARDARQMLRVARRHAAAPSGETVQQCQDTLAREMAASHGLTADQVHAALEQAR